MKGLIKWVLYGAICLPLALLDLVMLVELLHWIMSLVPERLQPLAAISGIGGAIGGVAYMISRATE